MLRTIPASSILWRAPLLVAVLVLLTAAPCQAVLHFTSNSYERTLSETAPIGSTVITLSAIPGTPGNSLVYHLFNHPPSVFQIDSVTGVITLAGTLDYEQVTSYTFNAEVIEGGTDSLMTTITVNIINEDDNPLTCAKRLLVVAIPEGSPDPSSIPLNCTDRDEPSPTSISYQIVSGNDIGLFSTDAEGNVLITSDLDYEERTLHEVVVNVTNSGVLSPQASVLLTLLVVVEPKNEYSPVFEGGNAFSFSVSESAAIGTTIGTLSASDADQGEDGVLTFAIEPGSPPGEFFVGPSTGHVVLVQSLDYEHATLHEFTVVVSDNSMDETERLSATATVSVHIEDRNEGTPSFSQDVYSEVVPETNPPGSTITTVQCSDTDLNSALTYSFIPESQSNFNINPSSGEVTLASALEYEADSHTLFQLSVQCEDSGDPSNSAQVPFLVEIEGQNTIVRLPSLPVSEYLVDVSEDSSPGITVATIAASDSNRGLLGPLQFSLTHSIHCPENLFHIDPVSSTMYTTGLLDYETASSYFCVTSIFNSDSPQDTRAEVDVIITVIDINDEPPVCSPTLYTIVIPEDSTTGSSVLTLSCSDADSSSLQFSLTDSSTPFQLSSSGVQATLLLRSPVNADVFSTYNLRINVSDGQFWTVLSVFVYVGSSNEHVPQFSRGIYDCEISEAAEIGTIICSVAATDSDSGPDGEVYYGIVSGNEHHTFAIDTENGNIVLAGYIDYEEVNGHMISVFASDNGDPAFSSSAQVRIRVIDSNDNAPVISSLATVLIAEDSTLDTVIANIQCSDIDSGVNGEVTLSLLHTLSIDSNGEHTETGIFTIDSITNDLILSSTLDYEEDTLFQVRIECMDNGTPSLSSNTTILVSIAPINEFPPQFPQDSYSITIAESSSPGTTVLEVTATDMDAGLDGYVRYSIDSVGASIPFLQISSTTGSISTAQQTNCEWGREHDFIVTAVDMGNPARTSEIELHVTLDNCRLGQLSPRQAVYFSSVAENAAVGTAVLSVSCSSSRAWGEAFAPEYTISSVSSPFQVDQITGVISVSTPPDYEQTSSHMIQITCRDPNNLLSFADFFVYITVLPENEHTPTFLNSLYLSETSEDTLPGTSILKVEASDADTNTHGDIMYSIEDGDQSVTVDPYTGVIYLSKFLDREVEALLSFHVTAYDQATPVDRVRSATAEVRVSITDVNDHSPECEQVVYHISVSPLVDVGHSLLRIQCSDSDSGSNSELHYSLSSDSEEHISLEGQTGELTLRQKFDPDSAPLHYITVRVQDSGVPPLSTSVLVVLDLQSPYTATSDGDIIDTEGLKNTVTHTLEDLSLDLWNDGAEEFFQSAVARSVTHYCALLPNDCSLESGCTGFYRRKRSATDSFYITFSELNVVLLNDHLLEFSSPQGVGYLNITFYVSLPEGASRATYRTTDYVIPKNTLAMIMEEEEPVIQAQVRDSVAPPLTNNRESAGGDHVLAWAVTVSVLLAVVILSVIIVVVVKAVMHRKKRVSKVAPVSLKGDRGSQTATSTCPPDNRRKQQKKETSIRLLAQRNSRPSICTESPHSVDMTSDDVSTILLDQEVDESVLGHPRSSRSATDNLSDFNVSSPSSGKSGNNSSVSGDYMQNFPFEPPRPGMGPRVLRVGHARVRTGWLDDSQI